MKTEYDWDSYPKWVKYVAVDDDMEVWGYSHKPYAVEQSGCWTTGNESHHKNIQLGHVYMPDWKSSLQRRPKQ